MKRSFSELNAFMWCPMRWRYGYAEGLEAVEKKPILNLGVVMHKVWAVYYRTKPENRSETLLLTSAKAALADVRLEEEKLEELWRDAEATCRAYFRQYSADVHLFGKTETKMDGGKAVIDLLVDHPTHRLMVIDHKVGEKLNTLRWELDFQTRHYCYLTGATTFAVNQVGVTKRAGSHNFLFNREVYPISVEEAAAAEAELEMQKELLELAIEADCFPRRGGGCDSYCDYARLCIAEFHSVPDTDWIRKTQFAKRERRGEDATQED